MKNQRKNNSVLKTLVLLCIIIFASCVMEKGEALNPIHDFGISKVSAPTSCIQGETIKITVTLENKGDVNESSDVKLIDTNNDKEISSRFVTIHSKNHTASEADLIFDGEPGKKNYFGDYTAIGGDVNGDGYKDILISSAGYPNGGMNGRGRAYLFYGGPNMDAVPDKIFTGENIGDYFSDGIHSISDLNNDGYADLMIGAPNYNSAGRLYIYYGGPDMDLIADVIIDSPDGKDCFFGFMPSTGDLNNDGYIDLCVVGLKYKNNTGRVYFYYGPIGSDANADKIFTGENENDLFGKVVIADGDIDNDTYDDLCITSRLYPNGNGRGRVYLYWGAGGTSMDEICDITFTGDGKWELGCGLAVYDVDQDQFADVIIGSHMGCNRAWLYWGASRSKFDNLVDITFNGENKGDEFGNYINVGYADKDRYPDIMINAYKYGGGIGRSYLYLGGTQKSIDNIADHTFEAAIPNWLSFQTNLIDVNNDGYDDIIKSGPGYNNEQGRALLWYGSFNSSITFNWDTTNASIGEHTLKVEIPPVPDELNTEDNFKILTIEITEPTQ